MFDIKDDIRLTRGDSAAFSIIIEDEAGNMWDQRLGDQLVLTVRKTLSSPIAIQIYAERSIFSLSAEDTAELELGIYLYDIVLLTAEGEQFTVQQGHFKLLGGVYGTD